MKPTLTIGNATVYSGNNLDILPTLPDNSVDSIVCDPPYELGFMGKSWDSSGIAYSVELWQECLRVLKPGGHLLAFGGTRTWHRLAVAIEDAGFEIRDNIAWLYGSGFPKSHNISKAIDKGIGENASRQLRFTKWMCLSGLTSAKARDILFKTGLITEKSNQASHYFAQTMGSQPAIATAEMFDVLRPYLPEVPEEIERLVAERTGIEWTAFKNRKVIGERRQRGTQGGVIAFNTADSETEILTSPATPEAKAWDGWGTALKPAHEPIVVARKPVIGTVAENVLTYGTGAINIDATRIGMSAQDEKNSANNWKPQGYESTENIYKIGTKVIATEQNTQGRWPANIILDEYTAELLDEQSGISKSSPRTVSDRRTNSTHEYGFKTDVYSPHSDSGGASRFFYVAKANKRDRNEGLDELPEVRHADRNVTDGVGGDTSRNRTNQAKQNFHPTVKPTALMQYLIRLVTPENGVVLDPFAGSGSTGKAAILENKHFIGIELTAEYLPIIEGRLTHAYETMQQQQEEDLFEQIP